MSSSWPSKRFSLVTLLFLCASVRIGEGQVGVNGSKRPVTVADTIQMTRWPWGELHFSPDNRAFVVILRKGNLDNNTNEYSIWLWRTNGHSVSPKPELLLRLSSSSNRAAITDVRWLADSRTIVFLGEHPGETHQLYRFDIQSHSLEKITHETANIVSYGVTAGGAVVAFLTDERESTMSADTLSRNGVIVLSQSLSSLLEGRYDKELLPFEGSHLFVQFSSLGRRQVGTAGTLYTGTPSLSPDGKYMVVERFVSDVPPEWKEYSDPLVRDWIIKRDANSASLLSQYDLIDVLSGSSRHLIDSPIRPQYGSEAAWSPDSRSVVVSDVYLPLQAITTEDSTTRRTVPFAVEVTLPSGEINLVSSEDLRLLDWNRKQGLVFLAGRMNWNREPQVFFHKSGGKWGKVQVGPELEEDHPKIDIEQDLNLPPKLVAEDPIDKTKTELLDLNPQFKNLTFGIEKEIHWRAPDGHDAKAGLYYPVDYDPTKRYPLVIQTHAYISGQFWIDGPWTTAYAAQPLASKGIMVLQLDEFDGHYNEESPRWIQEQLAFIESAIDYLVETGLVDRDRLGIVGFSATCTDVAYALTHSKYHFAAASLTDGQDGGYFGYIALSNAYQFLRPFDEGVNGGSPFGDGLKLWAERSPGFNAGSITSPLRIVALEPKSLLMQWELFSALSLLNKPVEMVYLPDGTHVLEKPWERMVSQQGNVDWFVFWLKGEEDPTDTKRLQYARWHKLRDLYRRH